MVHDCHLGGFSVGAGCAARPSVEERVARGLAVHPIFDLFLALPKAHDNICGTKGDPNAPPYLLLIRCWRPIAFGG
jgi:hypothetical protein